MGRRAEELPQGVAVAAPRGGRIFRWASGPYGPYPRVVAAPGGLPDGGMRGAAATAVSSAYSRMYDSSVRAEACSACVTRGRGASAWKSAAPAPGRTLCVPKLEASPPTVRMVLVGSALKARVEWTPPAAGTA